MIREELAARGLPAELQWLPVVESGFKPRAFSWAAAAGMWQFIYDTGKRYGLQRSGWVDDRFDPHKATPAALGYLGDLYAMFDDWFLALAAYNCGEYRRTPRDQPDGETGLLDHAAAQGNTELRAQVPRGGAFDRKRGEIRRGLAGDAPAPPRRRGARRQVGHPEARRRPACHAAGRSQGAQFRYTLRRDAARRLYAARAPRRGFDPSRQSRRAS